MECDKQLINNNGLSQLITIINKLGDILYNRA